MLFNYPSTARKSKRSQSALEYMMTYGWAILIIVIVAVILYSMGIFNPSSSITSTITGFSNLGSVTAECFNGGGLVLSLGDSTGNPIKITEINTTSQSGLLISNNFSTLILPSGSANFVVPGACSNTTGVRYSNRVIVTYMEPGKVLPGPYVSSGAITGTTTSQGDVAEFNGVNSYINVSKGYPAFTNLTMSMWSYEDSGEGTQFTSQCCSWRLYLTPTFGAVIDVGNGNNQNLNFLDSYNKWYFVTMTAYNSGDAIAYSLYLNQTLIATGTATGGIINSVSSFTFGSQSNCMTGCLYDGELADLQIYNSTLSSTQVKELYSEGLGGAPLPNAGLVAWWPLDGNANDYNGYNNNGIAVNVKWVSP